jgi:hypothetical protein
MHANSISRVSTLVLALALASCAGQSWDQVREQDSPAAYRRFVADHPSSPHAAEAQERIAVLQIERDPTPEALERFQREHPASTATAQLTERLETRLFEAARAEATPAAYDRFVESFASGALADRARANAEYLRASAFAGRPDALALFLQQHPTSDYAPEAQRSLAAIDGRSTGRLGAVGLRIEIASGVGEADRLRNLFSERAHEIYAAAGVPLVDGAANTTLTIRHDEHAATANDNDNDGRLSKSGVVADTTVSLQRSGDAEAIWSESFHWSVQDVDKRAGGSALFANSAAGYWERFFVPVATWPTQLARRPAWTAGGALAGIEAGVSRAIALSPNGSFRELDLSDPSAPRVVASYERPAGIAHFSGVRRVGDRVVLFGEDGIEVVARKGGAYRLLFALDRGSVGAVSGVEEVDGQLLAAGTRGLVRASLDGGGSERIFERPLRGIARAGDTLLVIDDQWLYAGSAHDPGPSGFATVAELGRGLEVRGLRVGDGVAVVLGARGIACFAVSGGPVRTLARPRSSVVGSVSDAAILGGSVFLIGERGLQVFDPVRGRVVDAVDVKGRAALAAGGGHLVAIGGDRLEVIDASPWIARSAPAAPAR